MVTFGVLIFSAAILLILLRIITLPLRLIWKLTINTLCGFVALVFINLLGDTIGFCLGFNLLTATVVGFLGLPGIAALLVVHYLLL